MTYKRDLKESLMFKLDSMSTNYEFLSLKYKLL